MNKMRVLLQVLSFCMVIACNAQVLRTYSLVGLMNGQSTFSTTAGQLYDLPTWGFATAGEDPAVTVPGPTIYANEGDSVHIIFLNASGEGHTIHLHGLDVDEANDGVPHNTGFVQENETFTYRFKATHAGNFLYHCHVTTTMHLALGMYGKVVIYPEDGSNKIYTNGPTFDRQYEHLFSELEARWNMDYTAIGSFLTYSPDVFLVNGKNHQLIYEDTSVSMQGNLGDDLLMRLFNVGYRTNRVIFPEQVTATVYTSDGRVLENSFETDTLLLHPGERYSVLLNVLDTTATYVSVDYLSPYRMQFLGREYIPLNHAGFNYIPPMIEENDSDTIGVGIHTLADKRLLLYPNPASESLFIEATGANLASVQIHDMQGRLVLFQDRLQRRLSLDISQLSDGMYCVSVLDNSGDRRQTLLMVR